MADLDGDGRAEILSGRRESEQGLHLFLFTDGSWRKQEISPGGDYGGVAFGDLTGDGVPDVLAAKTAGRPSGLELYETRRDGASLSFVPIPSPYPGNCDDLDVADLDRDGDLDFVVSSRGNRVFLNAGDGRTFEKIELDSDVYEDTGILLADVNGDHLADVLSTNHPGKSTRLFLGAGKDPVRYHPRNSSALPPNNCIGFKIAAGDLYGDGHLDLAIGNQRGVHLFRGNGCQGPEGSWWTRAPLDTSGSQAIQPVLADLDRDGHPNLIYTSAEGLHIRLNDGQGRFGPRLQQEAIPDQGEFSGCAVADWDQDGRLDLALSSFQGNGLRLLRSGP